MSTFSSQTSLEWLVRSSGIPALPSQHQTCQPAADQLLIVVLFLRDKYARLRRTTMFHSFVDQEVDGFGGPVV
jgi:hypothetical protein